MNARSASSGDYACGPAPKIRETEHGQVETQCLRTHQQSAPSNGDENDTDILWRIFRPRHMSKMSHFRKDHAIPDPRASFSQAPQSYELKKRFGGSIAFF